MITTEAVDSRNITSLRGAFMSDPHIEQKVLTRLTRGKQRRVRVQNGGKLRSGIRQGAGTTGTPELRNQALAEIDEYVELLSYFGAMIQLNRQHMETSTPPAGDDPSHSPPQS
jgi:hypothetical protein